MGACRCSEKKRPLPTALPPGSNDRPRQWFVLRRNESSSAFNGYHAEWSDFSTIQCRVCGGHWRSRSRVVEALPNCEFWPEFNPPAVEPWPQ